MATTTPLPMLYWNLQTRYECSRTPLDTYIENYLLQITPPPKLVPTPQGIQQLREELKLLCTNMLDKAEIKHNDNCNITAEVDRFISRLCVQDYPKNNINTLKDF
eukprot:Phypoly_transcript_14100.p2 GENE.Phypoly_transcript_14100~~Phypoly_transcript_14100.p2  ORF type:complete len:105 (-),score=16.61 Phypoly_transcript_14100:184-498(-)